MIWVLKISFDGARRMEVFLGEEESGIPPAGRRAHVCARQRKMSQQAECQQKLACSAVSFRDLWRILSISSTQTFRVAGI